MFPARELDFETDGRDWPFREASRFVQAAGIRWHVQTFGEGPVLLLLHGTGAATHSWRGLVPLLRPYFRSVSLDLPGHGFTQRPPQSLQTLPGMAAGVGALLEKLDAEPALIAGHSAGAAVMLRMVLDRPIAPKGLISFNGALKPYGGSAATWMSPIAKMLFVNPFMPRFFAWQAGNKTAVERLIRNTGSNIDAEGIEHYRILVSNPDHVSGALGMMANWELTPLARDLRKLDVPLLLVAARDDKAIKSEDAFAIRDMVKGSRVAIMPGLGHLAHEEAPDRAAELVLDFARDVGALSSPAAGAKPTIGDGIWLQKPV